MLSAAAPAAAQMRVGRAVEGPAARAVAPSAGMEVRREFSPATSPLPPSLSAPSVSPDATAVVLPVLNSPAVPPSPLLRTISPTPSRADRQTSLSVPSAAEVPTPAAPSADNPTVALDALFDGSLPVSREVLERAAARGLDDAVLARAISASQSPPEAAARLSALGLLGPRETALAVSKEDDFSFLLTRLWRKTAPSIPAPFPVDATFGVPALKVERNGVTYFVHGVAHGQLSPPRRWAVLSLVRRIAAAGHALYSEQNLPAYYGYAAGRETLDHASVAGAPAVVVAAAPNDTLGTLLFKRAINGAVTFGGSLASLTWVLSVPAAPVAWILLAAFGVYAWLMLTGGLPVKRCQRLLLAAAARADGLEDKAEQYADEANNFFIAKPDLEVLRGLELPQPLGAQDSNPYSVRSRAIADAVAPDAAAAGASNVHIVTGHWHAHETAWRLASGSESQIFLGPIDAKNDTKGLMRSDAGAR